MKKILLSLLLTQMAYSQPVNINTRIQSIQKLDADSARDLDNLIVKAVSEPAYRPSFLKKLLSSYVIVLGYTKGEIGPNTKLIPGDNIMITLWTGKDGKKAIPFFSSLTTFKRANNDNQKAFLILGKDLFETTRGIKLVLNPMSIGKEFLPHEVETILAEGINASPSNVRLSKDTDVKILETKYSTARLVHSLTQYFRLHPEVESAYMVSLRGLPPTDKDHLVIGVVLSKDNGLILKEAGPIALDSIPNGEIVNFLKIIPNEVGLSTYFLKSQKPFYKK